MKESARYVKIVEWSDEDRCFVGSCPGLLYGGCHGKDEVAVFEQLCAVVEDAIKLYKQDGRPLPPPTSGLRQQDAERGLERWSNWNWLIFSSRPWTTIPPMCRRGPPKRINVL